MNIALFASGSSGNCALVSDGDTHILLDAGISARRIRAGLTAQDVAVADLAGVLVTHEHSDHVKGLAVLLRRDPTAQPRRAGQRLHGGRARGRARHA